MIDAKELCIGAHIKVRGERCCIESIDADGTMIGYYTPSDWEATDPSNEWVEPIPITPELLEEIGFNQEQNYYILTLPEEATIYADAVEDDMGNWNIQVFATKLYKRGEVFVRYLHELENFIYLTLHKELIEE